MHVVRRLCSFSLMFSRVRVSGFGSRVPPGFRVWLQGSSRVNLFVWARRQWEFGGQFSGKFWVPQNVNFRCEFH